MAHSVNAKSTFFGWRCYNDAAWTHAKGIGSARITTLLGIRQAVVGCGKCRMPFSLSVACLVDQCLRVLDSKAYRERSCFKLSAMTLQKLPDIVRAVACGANNMICFVEDCLSMTLSLDACSTSGREFQIGTFCLKMILGTERLQISTNILQELYELVRADVGLGIDEDISGCSVLDHPLIESSDAAVGHAGVELSVGIGACTTLAKANIGFGIQIPFE